jgi:UDP-N-acetylmuramoylalanine--D-glutamate ligase
VRPPLPRGPYLIVGLARSGVAASLALRSRSEQVIGIDRMAADAAAAGELLEAGVEIHTGGDGLELLDRVRCVVKSPGVPREAPIVAAALERGITVIGELELAWRMLEQPFIAVTGTNGKTTTATLVGAIHRTAGLAVEVAGNVGRALSELAIAPLPPETTIVCEASSFQLEDTLEFAPEAAVLLNLTEDHLDRHHTIERYREAKLRIFKSQPAGSIAVLPDVLVTAGMTGPGVLQQEPLVIPGSAEQVLFGSTDRCALQLRDGVLHWHDQELISAGALGARGPLDNSMAAAAVALACGVPIEAVREALATFRGVAHRLEQVATIGGVLYVNDSKATNVASTLAALDTFEAGSVLLILGGQGKSQDFGPLRDSVAKQAAHTYLIGEDANQIAATLAGLPLTHAGTLARAVELARAAGSAGMVVLLSPACASYDQFADFEARGGAFTALVTGQG